MPPEGPTGDKLLIIDDQQSVLDQLTQALTPLLPDGAGRIITWRPQEGDVPQDTFEQYLDQGVGLVVTDYDLTTGLKGFFGLSIVGWCQQRSIPVGNFSRAPAQNLPREPNLFEIRIPPTNEAAASYINEVYRGFAEVNAWLRTQQNLEADSRPAQLLAGLLGRPSLESDLAPFMAQVGPGSAAILDRLRAEFGHPGTTDKKGLLGYVLGHVLLNAILKYPGPILHLAALCAYCGTSSAEGGALAELFNTASYDGPFGRPGQFFWRSDVDALLDDFADSGEVPADEENLAAYNRLAVEHGIGRALLTHDCRRCDGRRGGYWCPFTERAVCELSICSVPSSSWVPRGAGLARVEKDFYDEWSPLLGY